MDKGASVLAKLKNKAKETGKSLQVHLRLFCQEEFLRKLSMSKYADNLKIQKQSETICRVKRLFYAKYCSGFY